jgi:hypothetical protein
MCMELLDPKKRKQLMSMQGKKEKKGLAGERVALHGACTWGDLTARTQYGDEAVQVKL